MMKRTLSLLLALLTVAGMLPLSALAAELTPLEPEDSQVLQLPEAPAEETLPAETEPQEEAMAQFHMTLQRDPLLIDGREATEEDLFAGYVESVFFGAPAVPLSTGNLSAGARLRGDEALAYQALVPIIKQIAAGERSSATIILSPTSADAQVTFRQSYQNFDGNAVFNALWYDYAYEMYWCWSVSDCDVNYDPYSSLITTIKFRFAVEPKFRITSTGFYVVNTDKTSAAKNALNNAKAIVQKYDGKPVYDKLLGYKNEICDLNDYNYDATKDDFAYKDYGPWQILYVFDQDPATNVVCGGYAKAFQYLCDQGGIPCYYILGYTPGYHAWNIVTIRGKNYLVDVTNSEPGYWGQDGELFLAGASGDVYNGYTITDKWGNTLTYTYQLETKINMINTWGTSVLTLSATDYVPCSPHHYSVQVTKEATCASSGVRTHTCSGCGHVYTEIIPKAEHQYVQKVVEPTCTDKGYTAYTCSVCGDSNQDSFTDALGHREVTSPSREATCTTPGATEGRYCSVCLFVFSQPETIPVRPHNYVNSLCDQCGKPDTSAALSTGVSRIAGADRQETALKTADAMKELLGIEKFQTMIYTSGDNFADALAGSYLAARKSAPILLYRKSGAAQNLNYILNNLSHSGLVYILGGTSAVPAQVETELLSRGIQVVRLSGDDRFETNIRILQTAGFSGGEILVCTGYNFADSLSASATGKPILLVSSTTNRLTEDQMAYLSGLDSCFFTIIGGTSAVSTQLEQALAAYGSVSRLMGDTRYETSVAVAQRYFSSPAAAVLAYGWKFPDGLCGGPLAYLMGAPLLLADNENTGAAQHYTGGSIDTGYVLGGAGLISDSAARTIFSLEETQEIPCR